MLGAIIGDIVGSRFEFNNHRSKKFTLFDEKCFITDDSIITLAVASAIMRAAKNKNDKNYSDVLAEQTVKAMQKFGRKYPGRGYGGRFAVWITSREPKPYNSCGNGAAMRISPVGFYAQSRNEVCELSKIVTSVTHNHIEGIKGAEAAAMAIFLARQGSSKEEIGEYINDHYYRLNFTIDEIRPTYKFDETCQKTVPQAIKAFLESESFEDAIRIAISLGGDSDTIAAITGPIAEAHYGIPDKLRKSAFNYFDDFLLEIFNNWEEFLSK